MEKIKNQYDRAKKDLMHRPPLMQEGDFLEFGGGSNPFKKDEAMDAFQADLNGIMNKFFDKQMESR